MKIVGKGMCLDVSHQHVIVPCLAVLAAAIPLVFFILHSYFFTTSPMALEALHQRLTSSGQEHVLKYLDELNGESREEFLKTLSGLDFDQLAVDFKRAMAGVLIIGLQLTFSEHWRETG
jgi:hypothetical protein